MIFLNNCIYEILIYNFKNPILPNRPVFNIAVQYGMYIALKLLEASFLHTER